MKRTMPFPGFSRGVPIIGGAGPRQPEPGLYVYLASYFVQRPGEMPQAESTQCAGDGPLDGHALLQLIAGLEKQHAEQASDKPAPRVVLLGAPLKIRFVPQAQLAAEQAEKDAVLVAANG